VNDLENRLRKAYLAAAELIREDAVPAVAPAPRAFSDHRASLPGGGSSGQSRRAWRIAPLAAAAAVTAIGVTAGIGVPHLLSAPHARQVHSPSPARARAQSPSAAATSPAAIPGLPEFVVVSSDTGLEVIQTGTGHVTGQVSTPAGQIFARLAGDDSDRVFYVAAQQADPTATCQSYFYRFSLNAAGQASALTPLPGGVQAGLPTALAVSADGSKLAFSITHCASNAATSMPLSQVSGYIGLVDTASGAMTRNWTFSLGEDYATALALTPDGSQLAVAQYPPGGSAAVAKKLGTGMPSGTVDQASTVIGLPGVNSLSVGVDLYGCIPTQTSAENVANQLGVYDPATGQRTAVVHTWTGFEASCWLAPNAVDGNVLVAIDGRQPHGQGSFVPVDENSVVAVNVSTGRLTTLLTTTTPSGVSDGAGIPTLVGW
jgi:hypothetical protein